MKEAPLSRTNAIAQENDLTQSPQGKTLQPPGFSLTAEEGQAPMQFYNEKKAQKTRCEVTADGSDPKWKDFCKSFNVKFQSVLHVFSKEAMKCQMESPSTETVPFIDRSRKYDKPTKTWTYGPSPAKETYLDVPENYDLGSETANAKGYSGSKDGYAKVGEQSGNHLSPEVAASLFTVGQRDKLMAFMETNMIPEQLFNGNDIGNTTAQQRILMSALILSKGEYNPGSFTQRVHARMCWHWAHITNDYAGTTAGSFNLGMMGSTDMLGTPLFTNGKSDTYFNGIYQPASKLPKEEEQGYGPIPKSSGQSESLDKEQKKMLESADPTNYKQSIGRKQGMNWDQLSKIEPGDWLYVFNANGSNIGCHSVIFSHWSTGVVTENVALDASKPDELSPVQYRSAVFFSQGSPNGGGKEHKSNIGTQFTKVPLIQEEIPEENPKPQKPGQKPPKPKYKTIQDDFAIIPVTWATRFSPDSNPATTAEEMVPPAKEDATKLDAIEKFLTKFENDKGFAMDREKLSEYLREKALEKYYDRIKDDLNPSQQLAILDIIASGDLLALTKIMQRMAMIANNVEQGKAMSEASNPAIDAKHQEWEDTRAPLIELKTSLEKEVKALEVDLASKKLEKYNNNLPGLKKEKKDLEAKLKPKKPAKGKGKAKGPDPLEAVLIEAKIKLLQLRIDALESDPATTAEAKLKYDALTADVKKLETNLKTKQASLSKASTDLEKVNKAEPYQVVHPGNWPNSQDNSSANGDIKAVLSEAEMEPFLTTDPSPKKVAEQKRLQAEEEKKKAKEEAEAKKKAAKKEAEEKKKAAKKEADEKKKAAKREADEKKKAKKAELARPGAK